MNRQRAATLAVIALYATRGSDILGVATSQNIHHLMYNCPVMSVEQLSLEHIVVLAHPQVPEALEEMVQVVKTLEEYGFQADQGTLHDEALRLRIKENEFDLLIALGGDGTMLRAGHLCGPIGIPILGINMGRFGFLTELHKEEWREVLQRLNEGDFWIERRMMLRAEQWRAGELLGSWNVLNEVVVTRGHTVRPVQLIASVDGRYLTTYVADGLIAATPTGSTAYALAVGGPILPPDLRNILLVPVAPHLSLDRAIVLAEGSTVSIVVHAPYEAVLSPDGQVPIGLADGDRVDACASEHTVQFLRFQDPGYFYRNLTPHMSQNPSTGKHR
jgi:NAD+ kinase